MLQDQIFASDKWLKTGNNADIATKFLQATLQGLDLLPRQRPEVRRHRARQGLAAGRQPPGLADERDQRPDLAVAERHRPARQDALRPDHPDRHDLQGPEGRAVRGCDPDGPRPEGARRAGIVGRHQGRELHRRARSRSRRAATRSRPTRQATEGRPARAGPPVFVAGIQPRRSQSVAFDGRIVASIVPRTSCRIASSSTASRRRFPSRVTARSRSTPERSNRWSTIACTRLRTGWNSAATMSVEAAIAGVPGPAHFWQHRRDHGLRQEHERDEHEPEDPLMAAYPMVRETSRSMSYSR